MQRTLRIGRKLLRRCRDELIDAGYLICDANQSRDDLNRFTTLNYVVRDIPISSSPDIPKPQRPAPLRPRSNGNNKDQIKTDLNNTLPKPLSPENEEKGLAQQVLYSEMGRRALEAGGHPVYVGSKPYDAWLRFRGADGMPSFVDRGAVVVYDAIIDDDRRENTFGLMMSLNMLIETAGGFDYTGEDCQAWMREVGFSKTRVEPLVGPDSMVIGLK